MFYFELDEVDTAVIMRGATPVTGAGAYMISSGQNGGFLILLWASQFLLSMLLPTAPIIAILAGSLTSIIGSYLIKIASGEDIPVLTQRQAAGAILDLISQITLSAGISVLAGGAVGTVGLIPFTILVLTMAIFDWIIFFYASYFNEQRIYCMARGVHSRRLS